MNRNDVINQIAKGSSLTKAQVRHIFDQTFTVITGALSKGEKVQITGFGTFSVKKHAGRMGTNPRTGEKIFIEPKLAPAFTAGKNLKTEVNKGKRK